MRTHIRDKVLNLMNLLTNRQGVSINTITKVCNMSKRSAYRYIQSLSEANIPVYYDKDSRSYKLIVRNNLQRNSLSFSDSIMIIISILKLSNKVDNTYREVLKNIIKKITVACEKPIEDLIDGIDNMLNNELSSQNINEIISLVMIYTGIQNNLPLALTIKQADDNSNENRKIIFKNPSLFFNQEWKLSDLDDHSGFEVPINQIQKVDIL